MEPNTAISLSVKSGAAVDWVGDAVGNAGSDAMWATDSFIADRLRSWLFWFRKVRQARLTDRNVYGVYIVVNGNMMHFISRKCNVLAVKAIPRPYHHGNLREALLRAAEETLETRGVQCISLRELSRELGVSHTSPRRHFANKQALLDALALRGFERFDLALSSSIKDREHNFQTRLTKITRAFVSFALKHSALLGLMVEAKHRADAPRELLEASEKAFGHTAATFAEGQTAGEVVPGDPWRLCLVVFAAMQGLIALSTNGKIKGVPLDRLVGEIIERLILGLRPRP